MVTKTKKSSVIKLKKNQTFVRLNLDDKLENLIKKYEARYSLLNRGDIIRMLLSEVVYKEMNESKIKLANFLKSLPKPTNNLSEEEIFEILNKNDLLS
jgi:hypothetical protein